MLGGKHGGGSVFLVFRGFSILGNKHFPLYIYMSNMNGFLVLVAV